MPPSVERLIAAATTRPWPGGDFPQRPPLTHDVRQGVAQELAASPKARAAYAKLDARKQNAAWLEGIDELAEARAVWCLASGLCHPHDDVQIRCAGALGKLADRRPVPFMLVVAEAFAVFESGSENATLHGIFQHALADALNATLGASVHLCYKGQDPDGLKTGIPVWKQALERDRCRFWLKVMQIKEGDSAERVEELLGEQDQTAHPPSVYPVLPYSAALSYDCWVYLNGVAWGQHYEKDVPLFGKERPTQEPPHGYAVIIDFDKDDTVRGGNIRLVGAPGPPEISIHAAVVERVGTIVPWRWSMEAKDNTITIKKSEGPLDILASSYAITLTFGPKLDPHEHARLTRETEPIRAKLVMMRGTLVPELRRLRGDFHRLWQASTAPGCGGLSGRPPETLTPEERRQLEVYREAWAADCLKRLSELEERGRTYQELARRLAGVPSLFDERYAITLKVAGWPPEFYLPEFSSSPSEEEEGRKIVEALRELFTPRPEPEKAPAPLSPAANAPPGKAPAPAAWQAWWQKRREGAPDDGPGPPQ